MKKLIYISILLWSVGIWAQEEKKEDETGTFKSIRPKRKKQDSITFTALDYKIISLVRDTTAIDTSLTVRSEYKHHPVGKDMFEYMEFSNMGQTYNALAIDLRNKSIRPEMGATANNFYYIRSHEVPYYYLPTPITEFMYKSGIEQGQVLHTLFAANINPNLNIFVRYNALRSLGKYQNILSSIGNFVGGASYTSKNKRYWIFGHYSDQDIFHQENGGLSNPSQFTSGDPRFSNRGGIDVSMTDAETEWISKRYFLHHQFNFLRNENAINAQILLKHQIEYESKHYSFSETSVAPNGYLGDSYTTSKLYDKASLKTFTNQLGAELVLPYLGQTYVYGKSYFYNYFFNRLHYDINGNALPNKISKTDYGIGLSWNKSYKGFLINASGEQMILGTLLGTYLSGKIGYELDEKNKLYAGIQVRSAMPNFNMLLYQSDYKNYNWYNLDQFERENTQTLFADLHSQWGNASVDINNISNYTYFKLNDPVSNERLQSKPAQYSGAIQHLKVKVSKDFKFWKFGLDNTLMYQQVIQDDAILNVPTFTTRNTLYYSDYLFEKAMYLQTGVSFKYFTSYYANRYNPLLSEFEVQTQEKIGNYPLFDFFINAKVRTMRIFLKLEHFNSSFFKYDYFAAPQQPYRDLIIRFGVSWNFFT